MRINEIMSQPIVTAPTRCTLDTAARLMTTHVFSLRGDDAIETAERVMRDSRFGECQCWTRSIVRSGSWR
jgi:predicted transcriptional regulator